MLKGLGIVENIETAIADLLVKILAAWLSTVLAGSRPWNKKVYKEHMN